RGTHGVPRRGAGPATTGEFGARSPNAAGIGSTTNASRPSACKRDQDKRLRTANPAYNPEPMPREHRPTVAPLERRLREFWALFDSKDYEALLAMMTVDALETDDFAKVWLRGHAAIGENFA